MNPTYTLFFNRIFKVIFSGLVCILLFISLNSKFLIEHFADLQFYAAWKYVPILTLGTFLSCISAFFGVNFNASRESKYLLFSSIFGSLTSVVLNFILIPYWGIWGASVSVVVSFFTIAVARYLYSKKYVRINDNIYYILLSLGAILALALYSLEYSIPSVITSLILLLIIIIYNSKEIHVLIRKGCLLLHKCKE